MMYPLQGKEGRPTQRGNFAKPALRGRRPKYGLIRLLIHVHARRAACRLPEPTRHTSPGMDETPRFRVKNVSTCTRSPTARGSSHASHYVMGYFKSRAAGPSGEPKLHSSWSGRSGSAF